LERSECVLGSQPLLPSAGQSKHPIENGAKNATFAPFIYKTEHFTKTGSGQTYGKLKKEWRFSQAFVSNPPEFLTYFRTAEVKQALHLTALHCAAL
jgi:hypothetical protein